MDVLHSPSIDACEWEVGKVVACRLMFKNKENENDYIITEASAEVVELDGRKGITVKSYE